MGIVLLGRFKISDVGCLMSDVGCRMFDVECLMSNVRCRIADWIGVK